MAGPSESQPRRGVVAVVVHHQRLLVIRRSSLVAAPRRCCFPGGHIEPGESDEVALRRELREELDCDVQPLRLLWTSITSRNVHLRWWLAELDPDASLLPQPAEVEAVHWLTVQEIDRLPDLLESNREFLAAWRAQDFAIDGL